MQNSEMMMRFEEETGQTLEEADERGITLSFYLKYIQWLETKAAAYDRLMSGSVKMTMQEMANFKGFPITIDSDWTIKSHGAEPKMVEMPHEAGFWVNEADDEEEIDESFVEIPDDFDWKTSLTIPDGWEEA